MKDWTEIIDMIPIDWETNEHYRIQYWSTDAEVWKDSSYTDPLDKKLVLDCARKGEIRYRYRDESPPEPLLTKSGDTWVLYFEGVNYLLTYSSLIKDLNKDSSYSTNIFNNHREVGFWSSFTGDDPEITELDDDIATLRPKVAFEDEGETISKPEKLIYIFEGKAYTDRGLTKSGDRNIDWGCLEQCRLATYEELVREKS